MAAFAERNRQLAASWRGQVELQGGWRRSASQAGGLLQVDPDGEARGFFVELDAVPGRRAYLKPLKRHALKRAAREKIAADLAYELGVVVPPVLLTVNERVADAERHACVSLLLYPHQFSWGQLKDFLAEGESPLAGDVASLIPEPAARAFAFDTWVGQGDHGDHPSNIVFGYEGADYRGGEFIFLDYAFSMGVSGGWNNDGARNCPPAPFPARMCGSLSGTALEQEIAAIEHLSDSVIAEIVTRVPWQWLPDEEKLTILGGLLSRRAMVRAALAGYIGGRP